MAGYDGAAPAAGNTTTTLFADFVLFEPALRNGAYVAVGDLNGDGFADLTGRGGIRVAVKNLDGDGLADLVVGAGTDAGSQVTGYLGKDFAGGTAAAAFDFDADPGFADGAFVG